VADEQPVKKKRRIRPASTETLRERTEKAQLQANAEPKPKRLKGARAFVRGFFVPIRFTWRPIKWLGRHLIPRYFRNSFKELRLVTWPGRKQSRQLTQAVILFAIVFAVFISLLDFGLDKVFKRILLK
jgi:preprotein translocase SecE subunit